MMKPTEFFDLYVDSVHCGESKTIVADEDLSKQCFDYEEFRSYQRVAIYGIKGVEFPRTDLRGAVFVDLDLRGNDFSEAYMDGARFVRCSLGGTLFPPEARIIFEQCQPEFPGKVCRTDKRVTEKGASTIEKKSGIERTIDTLSDLSHSSLLHVVLGLSLIANIMLITKI